MWIPALKRTDHRLISYQAALFYATKYLRLSELIDTSDSV